MHEAEHRAGQAGDRDHEPGRQAGQLQQHEPGVGAGDGGRRIRHVDLVHDAEHQREADADQGVGGAEQQAVGHRLQQVDDAAHRVSLSACVANLATHLHSVRRGPGCAAAANAEVAPMPATHPDADPLAGEGRGCS